MERGKREVKREREINSNYNSPKFSFTLLLLRSATWQPKNNKNNGYRWFIERRGRKKEEKDDAKSSSLDVSKIQSKILHQAK